MTATPPGAARRYPIHAMGRVFSTGDQFHEWIDSLHYKASLTPQERSAVISTYDSGYLAHWDYKALMKKKVQP